MLRKRQQFYYQILQCIDAAVLTGALALAHWLRLHLPNISGMEPTWELGPLGNYLWLLGIILPAGPLLLEVQDFYRIPFPQSRWVVLGRVVRAVFYLWLLLLGVIVFLRIPAENVSRGVLLLFIPVAVCLMMVRDAAFRLWHVRQGLVRAKRIMLCGSTSQRAHWRKMIETHPDHNLAIYAEIDLHQDTSSQFMEALHRHSIEIVLFEINPAILSEINGAMKVCESEGIESWVSADFITTTLARREFDEFLGQPLIVFRTAPNAAWQLLLKGMMDRCGAFLLLLITGPFLLLIALAIRVSYGSPVLFTQMRSGRHGRPFVMYKFHTMVNTAEQKQEELAAFNEMGGPVFKMSNDPRVTPLGKWLRRTSLDEFPQLWNVLRGK